MYVRPFWRGLRRGRVAKEERRVIYWEVDQKELSLFRVMHILSAKDALLFCALVLSNHLPASLLSPELYLFDCNFGEVLEGGLAWSLAGGLGESSEVDCGWWDEAALDCLPPGELCRRDTDWCAGGRREWGTFCCGGGIVPGGSCIIRRKLQSSSCYKRRTCSMSICAG